jgi:glycerol-1-phosphate dehydrogenase [NAD(P)+]
MTQLKTIYGDGILEKELNGIDKYVVVTDEVPWQLYQNHFVKEPAKILMPDSLSKAMLDKIFPAIPDGVEFIGLGGGRALDAAKYFAYLRDKTPILVPTITSTNAPFSDFMSITNGEGFRTGFKKVGWPKHIIVDYALIRKADPRFNRAGYGDLLFILPTLNDWRRAAGKGKGAPLDHALEETITAMAEHAIESAAVIGSMDTEGIKILMKLIEDSTILMMDHLSKPINAGSEHLFAWNLEATTGKHYIHGEVVALGILISSYLQGENHRILKQALDKAQVVYHPDRLGITWDEIRETLLTIEEYNRKVRQFHTIYEEIEWTPTLLAEIREMIYEHKKPQLDPEGKLK